MRKEIRGLTRGMAAKGVDWCRKSGIGTGGDNFRKNFEKGIDFIGKPRYNVKLYEIVALGGGINAQHQVL